MKLWAHNLLQNCIMNHKSFSCFTFILLSVLCCQEVRSQDRSDTLCYELRYAAWSGDSLTIRSLLDSTEVNINCAPYGEQTALSYAIIEGHLHLVEMLLPYGPDFKRAPGTYRTPLELAIRHQHPEIVELLILYGDDVNQNNIKGLTPLIRAVNNGADMVITDMLLHYGADPDLQMNDGTTPLLLAAMYGDMEKALLLIGYGADVNKSDIKGYTPLMIAAILNDTLLGQWLLYYGASADSVNDQGWRALDFAISNHAYEMVRLLMPFTLPEKREHSMKLAYAIRNKPAIGMLKREGYSAGKRPIITAHHLRYSLATNSSHSIWQYSYTLEDSRYNAGYTFGILHRYRTATVFHQLSGNDTLNYQLQGARYAFFMGAEKYLDLMREKRHNISLFSGIYAGYTRGRFPGSTMKPQAGLLWFAQGGIQFSTKDLSVGFGYRHMPTADQPVSARHMLFQAALRIPDKQIVVSPKKPDHALRSL
jgi:ankyrin repeat protein